MKEKIIEFSKGNFVYEQTKLKIEPSSLEIELDEGEECRGYFLISSEDASRIKGLLHTRMPGMELKSTCFYARATRVEFSYFPLWLKAGEQWNDAIYLESSAGEYEISVCVKIRKVVEKVKEEVPVLTVPEILEEEKTIKKGKGRREAWKKKRKQVAVLAEFQRVLENERQGIYSSEKAVMRFRKLSNILLQIDADSLFYALINIYVLLREGRKPEANAIFRKYEKSKMNTQKNVQIRAFILYISSLLKENQESVESNIEQLQKLYQKYPGNFFVTAFLLELDPKLHRKARTRYLVLERQFRAGTRNRLLYQEAWKLLEKDLALFTKLDDFTIQVFSWAARNHLLTAELATVIAEKVGSIKRWSPLASYLTKECYRVAPSSVTVGAVCAIYIRGDKIDNEAFLWYQKGVELDANITKLYEYYMYALPEDYSELLPKSLILYFNYNNTLTGKEKLTFYCNLVRYGSKEDAACEAHWKKMQEYLLAQLKQRKLDSSLAWLYQNCLHVNALETEVLEALTDLLFLKKFTCLEQRICQVELIYEQLERKIRIPVSAGSAMLPIYTADVKIVLLDQYENRYTYVIPYKLDPILEEESFLEECIQRIQYHTGLNLYLLDGKGRHQLEQNQVELVYRLLKDENISYFYQQKLKVELLELCQKQQNFESFDEKLKISQRDLEQLSRKEQAIYIEALILSNQNQEAFVLLQDMGGTEVNPRILCCLLQRLLESESVDKKLLFPYIYRVFHQGIYTEAMVSFLAECRCGTVGELFQIWKAGQQFALQFPLLEEHLVVQALFTEEQVNEIFPVFCSLDSNGGESTLGMAYLNYLSWVDFVKDGLVPTGLFDCLEHHFFWEDQLAEISVLSYLRQLSKVLLLSDTQKDLVKRLVSQYPDKQRKFQFMQKLHPFLDKKAEPQDQFIIEYRCNPKHKVALHYMLESHGQQVSEYKTEQIFPICNGIFVRSFILFYGEKLTWFFTEEKEDGTELLTFEETAEQRKEYMVGQGRYQRICHMQKLLDQKEEEKLQELMVEYEQLAELTKTKFERK